MAHTTDKKQINEAIYTVLTTQYKKDAKEAHSAVEAEGYEVYKFNGSWWIHNSETGRKLYLQSSRNGYSRYIEGNGNGRHRKNQLSYREFPKFDFVGFLDKPLNTEWAEMHSYRHGENRFKQSKEALDSARWMVTYHNGHIDDIQKELADLQKQLIYHTEQKVKAEQKLVETRKNLGLLK